MAIVHIATKAISRKAGQSAVASAAYRAGDILKDDRYDKSHDYSKKSGVMSADIILPSALKAKGLMVSREEIWNKAESVEGRTDSRVGREWLVNLPHELNEAKRKALAHEFAQVLADKYNIIADCAIHSPSKKEVARGADPRNYHAHILVTTREAKMGADGALFFDKQFKIPFEWSNKKRDAKGLQSSIKEIKDIRQLWVDMTNKALAELDLAPLDARSFKDQGLDRLPTVKMGVDATNMERKGINTENGNKNRAIHVINQRKEFTQQTKQRAAADERHTVEYTEWATDRVEWATDRVEWANNRHQQIVKHIDDKQQRIEKMRGDTEWAVGRSKAISNAIEADSNIADRNTRNAEWAIRRRERILKIVATREPDLKTREESVARFDQQAREAYQLIADRANAVASTPSPFDDNARRARAARLAREQERFDSAAEHYDSRAYYYSGRVKRAHERSEHMRLGCAQRLLDRRKEENRIRPGWSDSSDDYPNKFDYRQSDLLDAFAEKFKLDKANGEDHYDYLDRIRDTFNSAFVKENKAVMSLLRDPKAERDQYDAIKSHYDTFIEELDNRYKTIDSTMRNRLGNISDVSRRTAESLSAPSYLKELDNYINNEATADENKVLAIKCRSDKINRTCQLIKNGIIGLKDIREADKRQTHSEALQVSLNNFMTSYGNELSNNEQKAINDGLNAVNQQVRSNAMSYKR